MNEAVFKVRIQVEPDAEPEPWNGSGVGGEVVKELDEQRYTLALAYPANKPDVAVARDGHIDFAGEATVEKAAWDYLDDSRNVGLWHEDGTDGAGRVVESYIYRGPDWEVGESVIKAGDWLVGVVWDKPAWDLIKSGEINGISPQGSATREKPTPADVMKLRGKRG